MSSKNLSRLQKAAMSKSHQVVNRPGVAGAVLQLPPSLINSLSHPLVQNLQDTLYLKPEELGS